MTAAVTPQPVEEVRAGRELGFLKTSGFIIILILITGAAFWKVWLGSLIGGQTYDFVEWDDPQTIAANPDFNPPTWESVSSYWWGSKAPYLDLYIPMTYTAWAGVATIASLPLPDERGIALDPYPFHAANVLTHVFSVLLVFAILRLLVPAEWAAFLGAAIYALHPLQVEPIAWVSGFK